VPVGVVAAARPSFFQKEGQEKEHLFELLA
jgi:hypothetical protein